MPAPPGEDIKQFQEVLKRKLAKAGRPVTMTFARKKKEEEKDRAKDFGLEERLSPSSVEGVKRRLPQDVQSGPSMVRCKVSLQSLCLVPQTWGACNGVTGHPRPSTIDESEGSL